MSTTPYHTAVLCEASLDLLVTTPAGLYVDVTMGGGGHSRALLDRLSHEGRCIGLDQDPDAVANAPEDGRYHFLATNFRYLSHWLDYWGLEGQVDGILADLGVSSHHFDSEERGFSFRYEESMPDMRMNSRAGRTARDLLLNYSEEQLADILYYYGELHDARRIAGLVVSHRATGFPTISSLMEALAPVLPKGGPQLRNKLSRIFQALRIEVNDELGALRQLLTDSVRLLKPGGRLAIISYHSLEDRMVKDFFRLGGFEQPADGLMGMPQLQQRVAPLRAITRKAITPSAEEIADNNRARSAKLRVAELRNADGE
ncbi:MAG: 16S rRNA (cytosine(1402)-N(4))-methyltransferase RsmH [Porphyromonas sp.]|uniref:16S rRNA (cytosine(1402)-N(4))-methyltransferase RsmH n=1 Tax=Porphyromonas sp. TaxID=1924944 RepID=UPI001A502A7E|nr:16S rRNA (cytosine(1402)-N(4))-methyltransferase RsmH [Porphyromonas sp.]MBL6453263.1 16S rRNA (cytosine(1402)-N(4))-methyltransferase RsmH [Porphyromonas sp.]